MENEPVSGANDERAGKPAAEAAERRPDAGPPPVGAAYRVALDTYSGPLDLLLYLIRKNEVDITDIPVAVIAEQYRQYLDLMAEINVNVAGEFLVMAATLMEIKSRLLLPREEGQEEEEEEDPRSELVRQLLEYKRYKDLARSLGERAAEQALKYPRPGPEASGIELRPADAAEEDVDTGLEGVGLWELIDAFAKVIRETSLGPPPTRTLERERPIHEFRVELLRLVESRGEVTFSEVFAQCVGRDEKIAMFVALLELVRLRRLRVQQAAVLGEIYVCAARGDEPPPPAAPPRQRHEEPRPSGAAPRPVAVKAVDVLDEIAGDDEALGRSRERIDTAIRRVEAFLREHHEQVRRERTDAETDAPADSDRPAEPEETKGGHPE